MAPRSASAVSAASASGGVNGTKWTRPARRAASALSAGSSEPSPTRTRSASGTSAIASTSSGKPAPRAQEPLVEHERPPRPDAEARAERPARPRRRPLGHVADDRRAGDPALGREAVGDRVVHRQHEVAAGGEPRLDGPPRPPDPGAPVGRVEPGVPLAGVVDERRPAPPPGPPPRPRREGGEDVEVARVVDVDPGAERERAAERAVGVPEQARPVRGRRRQRPRPHAVGERARRAGRPEPDGPDLGPGADEGADLAERPRRPRDVPEVGEHDPGWGRRRRRHGRPGGRGGGAPGGARGGGAETKGAAQTYVTDGPESLPDPPPAGPLRPAPPPGSAPAVTFRRLLLGLAALAVGVLVGLPVVRLLQPSAGPAPGGADAARGAAPTAVVETVQLGADGPPPAAEIEVPDLVDISQQTRAVAAAVKPTVAYVEVAVPAASGFGRSSTEAGSGVILSPAGYVLTNAHVVARAGDVTVYLPMDKREYRAEVVGADPTTDIAVIRLLEVGVGADPPLPVASLGDSDGLEVGEFVLAVGSPFRLTNTVTSGIVSALGRGGLYAIESEFAIEDFIQTDAAINQGNSGGALVNLRGEVVGIVTAIASESGYYEGYGFAVPVNLARRVAEDLIQYGEVRRGYLGVEVFPMNAADARERGMPTVEGVLVTGVVRGGPAARAGLRAGDVLLEVGGRDVDEPNQFQSRLAMSRPREPVPLAVWRDGERRELRAVLADPADEALETWFANRTPAAAMPPEAAPARGPPADGGAELGRPVPRPHAGRAAPVRVRRVRRVRRPRQRRRARRAPARDGRGRGRGPARRDGRGGPGRPRAPGPPRRAGAPPRPPPRRADGVLRPGLAVRRGVARAGRRGRGRALAPPHTLSS